MIKLAILVLCIFALEAYAAGCRSQQPAFGPGNHLPMNAGNQGLVLNKKVPNGISFIVNVPNNNANESQNFYVTHLYGTAYQMGVAQGQLYGDRLAKFINDVWDYLKVQVEEPIEEWGLPVWLSDLIAEKGLEVALDGTQYMTQSFTGPHFYDEMRGLADGVGGALDYQKLVRVHMLAGLTQGKCSMLGAWGKAVQTGGLLQLRALDWDMDGPFRDYAAITVYHPNADQGHAFLSVGMTGFIGGLTGISETQLGISEIGVSYPDATFGSESRVGLPFIFLLRDILQFDLSLDDAINRMINAVRTCDLILGVGDGKANLFRAFQYSWQHLNIQSDVNQMPYNETWHPRIPSVVYYGMDWVCPSFHYVMAEQIKKNYPISIQSGISEISGVEMSGNNHLAWYDLTNMQLYVAFAAPHNVSGPVEAYARQYSHFDVRSLFAQKPLM